MTSTFIKHCAFIIGILIATGSQIAFAQDGGPQPAPGAASAAELVTVHGAACLDGDHNGQCTVDETPVMNVILRSVNGMSIVTDNAGRYSLQAPANSAIEVTIPSEYKTVNGNLRQIVMQVIGNENMDIALVKAGASPLAEAAPAASSQSAGAPASGQGNGLLPDNINLTALLDALVAVTLISFFTLVVVLISLRRIYTRSLVQQNRALKDQQEKDLDMQMQSACGWQAIAEQIIADALLETVSVDEQIGVLEAAIDPHPRFTVVTQDRRTIVFTTAPRAMKKSRLIRRGDRVIDVTAASSINHTSVCVLWQHILAMRNMNHATLPSTAHWYLVVRLQGSRITWKQKAVAGRMSAPRGSWLSSLRSGQ